MNNLLTQVQWTRVIGDPATPEWMNNGMALYEWLGPLAVDGYEVFPEETWKLAEKIGLNLETNLPLTWVCRVAKPSRLDVIDAVGSAPTAWEVHEGTLACIVVP